MCLGLPGRVVELSDDGDTAMVDVAGMTREIHVGLLPEPVTVGDYILIHSGFALERMTAEEARDALDILGSLGISG